MIFYHAVLGPLYRSRVFMRTNIRMSFDCWYFAGFSFFFLRLRKKYIRRSWTKLAYVDLHFDQPPSPREPVCLKNGGINLMFL